MKRMGCNQQSLWRGRVRSRVCFHRTLLTIHGLARRLAPGLHTEVQHGHHGAARGVALVQLRPQPCVRTRGIRTMMLNMCSGADDRRYNSHTGYPELAGQLRGELMRATTLGLLFRSRVAVQRLKQDTEAFDNRSAGQLHVCGRAMMAGVSEERTSLLTHMAHIDLNAVLHVPLTSSCSCPVLVRGLHEPHTPWRSGRRAKVLLKLSVHP